MPTRSTERGLVLWDAAPAKVSAGELPVGGHDPLLNAAQHLGAALAPVATVEHGIQVDLHPSESVEKRRRGCIPVRPDRSLVVDPLRHLDQSPFGLVELL